MERLTELYTYRNADDFICSEYTLNGEVYVTENMAINKLGCIEDIEESLNISTCVFFNALCHGIRILDDGYPYEESFVDLVYDYRIHDYKYPSGFKGTVSDHTVYFKDYGKTWTLRQMEELL